MTNLQLMLAIGIPTLTVLIGILLSRSDIAAIRSELVGLRGEQHSEISSLRSEFRSDMAGLRNEMVALRDSVHRDMVMLHERVAVVEARQQR